MADTQDTQAALRALRTRVEELEQRRRGSVDELRFAIVGTALAVAMVVLTATTWVVADDDGADEAWTLWGLVPTGWQALVMFGLVIGVSFATPALFLTNHPSRAGHLVMVWVSLLTAVWVIVVNAVVPDDADTAPGRWLTLLAALAMAAAHGFRAEELNNRQPALRRLGA
jgi:hypothetical protein